MSTEVDSVKPSTIRTVGPVTISTTAAVGVTTIACWILSLYGINPPPEVQGAITGIIVFLAGWIVPSKRGKRSM